jgi:hypothetical protein
VVAHRSLSTSQRVVLLGVVLVTGVVIAGFAVADHFEGRARRQLDDVALCGSEGAALFTELSVPPTAGSGSTVTLRAIDIRVSHTDAASAAGEFESAGLSQHRMGFKCRRTLQFCGASLEA